MKLAAQAIAVVLAAAPLFGATAAAPAVPPPYGVRVMDLSIAMPDGVRLAVNVFLPEGARAGERFPAILEYLPYRRTREVTAPGSRASPGATATSGCGACPGAGSTRCRWRRGSPPH